MCAEDGGGRDVQREKQEKWRRKTRQASKEKEENKIYINNKYILKENKVEINKSTVKNNKKKTEKSKEKQDEKRQKEHKKDNVNNFIYLFP